MSKLKPTRSAQRVSAASFKFSIGDQFSSAVPALDSTYITLGAEATQMFAAIKMPKGARVVGGQVAVLVAGDDTGAQTLDIGDANDTSAYQSSLDLKTAPQVSALDLTGATSAGEDLVFTLTNTNADGTAGTVQVDVLYVIDQRADEVVPN